MGPQNAVDREFLYIYLRVGGRRAGSPNLPQDAPGGSQEVPKTSQEEPKTPKEPPKTSSRHSQSFPD